MKAKKTAYDLSQSQVYTPPEIVKLFWRITAQHRPSIASVLDLGAGDGRFARAGAYSSYKGIEIDRSKTPLIDLPPNATVSYGCVFRNPLAGFSACIGNPPYVRHHDIEDDWRDRVIDSIAARLGVRLDRRANLFLYFLCLGLIKSAPDGLVSMVVPFEWVSRPSGQALREFLRQNGWAVSVYRFEDPVFPKVLTTSSITIIDKRHKRPAWNFFDIDGTLKVRARRGLSGTAAQILSYEKRSEIWALRGLSPGSQKLFTLTEWERLHHGLTLSDVRPCITSLRHLPSDIPELTQNTFRKYFVETGQRCWLIKCNGVISERMRLYLDGAPQSITGNYTCANRECWYQYKLPPKPQLLVSSGFVSFGPKAVVNTVGATSVGSVYGVYANRTTDLKALRDYLTTTNIEEKVVPHAGELKKIEVKQLNGVLRTFLDASNGQGE